MLAQDVSARIALMKAYCEAISTIWIVDTPLVGLGFILGKFAHRLSPIT